METTEIRPGVFLRHHATENCYGGPCPLHRPTDHEYREFPLVWRPDTGIMEREIAPGEYVPDPDDYKVRQGGYIYRNSVKCLLCDTEIVSTYTHDYKHCPCGAVSVDGGHDYLRRGWDGSKGEKGTSWVDTSIVLD